jgi:hypothetical protein
MFDNIELILTYFYIRVNLLYWVIIFIAHYSTIEKMIINEEYF